MLEEKPLQQSKMSVIQILFCDSVPLSSLQIANPALKRFSDFSALSYGITFAPFPVFAFNFEISRSPHSKLSQALMVNVDYTSNMEIVIECMTGNDTALLRYKIIIVSPIDQLGDFFCQRRKI